MQYKRYSKGLKIMAVIFSRHAKRRIKLYNISESKLFEILNSLDLSDGEHELIRDISGFCYPIKIVVAVENNDVVVITSYPLKKGRK